MECGPALREELSIVFCLGPGQYSGLSSGGTRIFKLAAQMAGGPFGLSAAGLWVWECRYLGHGRWLCIHFI